VSAVIGRDVAVRGLAENPRVLVCGGRASPRPAVPRAVLDHLLARPGDRLVVIKGTARSADMATHLWCLEHRFDPLRHRCHPVDWAAERRARPAGLADHRQGP
jgi:hypothetical protein